MIFWQILFLRSRMAGLAMSKSLLVCLPCPHAMNPVYESNLRP